MIRINLARKGSAGGGGAGDFKSLGGILAMLKGGGAAGDADSEGAKKFDINSPLVRLVGAIAVCWLLEGYLEDMKTEELAKVDAQLAEVEKEKSAVQAKLAKIKGFEPIKKQLEDDEKAIKLKLEVVTKLLDNRNAAAKMLMQIAQVIPDEVWLTQLRVDDKKVVIAGSTPGYNQVSDFIKALNGTSMFTDIALSGIQEVSSKEAAKTQTFDLTGTRRQGN